MTDKHPLRFAYLPGDYKYLGCYDRTDFPIMFIGDYALFRPNYTRYKHGVSYWYDNLVIVDLAKSYIDINKFKDLLHEKHIDLTQQKHIVNRSFGNANYDNTWYKLFRQASQCVSMTVQDTSKYYLSRIQYFSANNLLLITHDKYKEPKTYTLIDLNTLLVIESSFGVMQDMTEVTYDIEFDYFYESEFDELTPINSESGDDKLNYPEYHCKYRILADKLGEPKYTFKSIGVIKNNGLLFMETSGFTTKWCIDNMYKPAISQLEITSVPDDISCIVSEHILFEVFIYVITVYQIMRLICLTSIAYTDSEHKLEWHIPLTWDKFHAQTKQILV